MSIVKLVYSRLKNAICDLPNYLVESFVFRGDGGISTYDEGFADLSLATWRHRRRANHT